MKTKLTNLKKVYGLPKKKVIKGPYTRSNSLPNYIHHVVIRNRSYFKVHFARNSGEVSKIKYFKTLDQAKIFLDMLEINPYL